MLQSPVCSLKSSCGTIPSMNPVRSLNEWLSASLAWRNTLPVSAFSAYNPRRTAKTGVTFFSQQKGSPAMKKLLFLGILSALFFSSPFMLHAEELKSPALSQVQTYDQLVSAIRQARAASQARVEQAVQREKVREAWETGKLIDEHVLQHKERADYGKQVLLRLSKDLGISDTELGYRLQFARTYPISQPAGKLSWSHYMELLSLDDVMEQIAVAEMAEKAKWTRDQVREEVKKRKAARKGTGSAAAGGVPVPLEENKLTAQLGEAGTYRIVKATVGPEAGKVVIDLGFSNYYRTSKDLSFKPGELIETLQTFPESSSPSDKIRLLRPPTGGNRQQESSGLQSEVSSLLYTYRAWVVRVLDGDTIAVVVDLGFGVRSVQTLRLRGIDCPELVSAEGKQAKAFVESVITASLLSGDSKTRGKQSHPFILIKTTKSDKYDRYLADIFFTDSQGKQQYLNNLLLEKGHAVRVRE